MKATVSAPAASQPGSPFTPDSPLVAIVDPKEFALDGLFIAGQITGRQRREFTKAGQATRFVIALTVLTKDGIFKPERWCDVAAPSNVPAVGEHVCLKLGLSVYQSRGGTNFRLTWGDEPGGQSF